MPTPATLAGKSDEFLRTAASIWKVIKDVKKLSEPFAKTNDALDLANRAMTGDLPAYSPGIEKIRVFVADQKDKLADLARKDENYWAERSGANAFDQAAMVHARSYVDRWTANFSQLRSVLLQFLPLVQNARTVIANPGVIGLRSALQESSLPGLDGIAMNQIVGDLNNSVRSLDIILQRLRNCRLGLR